jgi:4-hydroxy-tetrahydrodipicolinate synthase
VILYNVPSRTIADLANDTVVRLSQVKNIVGIKEATGSVERVQDLMKRVRKDFLVFSGDDVTCLSYMLLGGHGVISVTANVAPKLMNEMCVAARAGNAAQAITINNRLLGLHRNLFLESNPIPVKWALGRMGRIAEGIRLPLTPFTAPHHETLAASLREAGCID